MNILFRSSYSVILNSMTECHNQIGGFRNKMKNAVVKNRYLFIFQTCFHNEGIVIESVTESECMADSVGPSHLSLKCLSFKSSTESFVLEVSFKKQNILIRQLLKIQISSVNYEAPNNAVVWKKSYSDVQICIKIIDITVINSAEIESRLYQARNRVYLLWDGKPSSQFGKLF